MNDTSGGRSGTQHCWWNENEAQELVHWFSNADRCFGLRVSLKKTEVLLQPANCRNYTTVGRKASNVELNVVDKFCYLGRVLSSNTVVDDDINSRLSRANVGELTLHSDVSANVSGAIMAY